MSIEELLNKYFEGETSSEEERQLRAFFSSGDVPQQLASYIPLFAYFDEEIEKRNAPKARRAYSLRQRILYAVSGIAAGLLLMTGIRYAHTLQDPCSCSDSYVVINGHCYTDISKAKTLAFEALLEVATPADEYFPETEMEAADRELIKSQIRELSDIFNDNE